jgi:lambda family phage tail tape measure protein
MADSKIVIGVSTEGVQKAKTDLNAIKDTGEQVVATSEKIDSANKKLNSSYKGTGGQIRNASYQLQDFITQVQGGTSATTALSQQLPQLLSGFGLIGVVAGVGAAAIGILINNTRLFETELGKLDRFAKLAASGMDTIRDSQMRLGDDATRALNEWAKSWATASDSVRKDMLKTLELQAEFDKMQVEILKSREQVDRLVSQGKAKESWLGVLLDGIADPKDRAEANKRLLELDVLERRLAAVNERLANPGGGLKATEQDKTNFAITIKQRVDALKTEAQYIGVSNAEREYGVMIAELEAQAKRMNIALDEKQLGVLKQLILDRDSANSAKKLKEYLLEQERNNDLIEMEAQAVNMTTREHQRLIDARKVGFDIQKNTQGMQAKDAQAYADAAWSAFMLRDAIKDLAYEQQRAFGTGVQQSFKKYKEDLGDVAKSSEALFTNAFKGIEDAMVSAFQTGKLSFKSMIDAMIADVTRMIIRQALLKPIYNAIGLGGGGGLGGLLSAGASLLGGGSTTTGLASLPSSVNTSFPTYEQGTNYVPNEGLAYLHKGEAVVPAKYNSSGGGSGNITFAPVINIDSRADQSQVRQLVLSAVRQGQSDLVDRINRGQVRVKAS